MSHHIPGVPQEFANPEALPPNKATLVCLRGPCVHYWSFQRGFPAEIDETAHAEFVRTCLCSPIDELSLNDSDNIYACDQWWPRALSFAPESLRAVLREPLRKASEWYLELIGYNFDWRWWPIDAFARYDRPGNREVSATTLRPNNSNGESAQSTDYEDIMREADEKLDAVIGNIKEPPQ